MASATDVVTIRSALAAWWQTEPAAQFLLHQAEFAVEALERRMDEDKAVLAKLEVAVAASGAEADTVEVPDGLRAQVEAARSRPAITTEFEGKTASTNADDYWAWAEARGRHLRLADLYWVTGEMADLVNAAYTSRPAEALRSDHPPCPIGFAWLASPALLTTEAAASAERAGLPSSDVRYGFRALSWGPASNSTGPALRLTFWFDTDSMPPERGAVADSYAAGQGMVRMLPWSVLWNWGLEEPSDIAMGAEEAHGIRWAQTFWALVQQPLVTVAPEPLPRGLRRRLSREGQPEPAVSVVTLRTARHGSQADPSSSREYRHRWLVRGFWRRQWYPSTGEHRPLWINDYVKGPDDRPFLVREKVYAWRR